MLTFLSPSLAVEVSVAGVLDVDVDAKGWPGSAGTAKE